MVPPPTVVELSAAWLGVEAAGVVVDEDAEGAWVILLVATSVA